VRLLPEAVTAGRRTVKQSIMPGRNKQGRLQVTLCKQGFTKRFQVHRLVLEAFEGPCPEGTECRHRDGNHENNCRTNLEWAAHGASLRGELNFKAKLTEEDVLAIRASNETQRDLAARYGVSQVAIYYIKARKTWKHVP
jgi:hypothetical protein